MGNLFFISGLKVRAPRVVRFYVEILHGVDGINEVLFRLNFYSFGGGSERTSAQSGAAVLEGEAEGLQKNH